MLFFLPLSLAAQIVLPDKKTKDCIPSMTQTEINQLVAADGYFVFNTTSGCLNYWFAGSWKEICGECTPQPTMLKIDSLVQKENLGYIYFTKSPNDSLDFYFLQSAQPIKVKSSPHIFSLPYNSSFVAISLQVRNACGARDTFFRFSYQPISLGEIEYFTVESVKFPARKIGNTWWMCEDYKNTSEKLHLKENELMVTIKSKEDVCPAGWDLPTVKEWDGLLQSNAGNYTTVFDPANNNNSSIGLTKLGFYNWEEKKYYSTGSASYHWANDYKNGKRKYVVVTENGTMAFESDPQTLYMPVRCIKR